MCRVRSFDPYESWDLGNSAMVCEGCLLSGSAVPQVDVSVIEGSEGVVFFEDLRDV